MDRDDPTALLTVSFAVGALTIALPVAAAVVIGLRIAKSSRDGRQRARKP